MSVARLIATMALDATNFVRGIAKGKQAADRLSPSLAGIKNQLGTMFSVAKLEAAIDAFGRLVRMAADAAAEVTRLSKAAGAAAEGWQVLRNAARDAGLDTGQLQTALQRLYAQQTEALGGSEKLQAAFAAFGVTAEDLASMGTDKLFAKIAAALKTQGQGAKESAALMDLFGARGAAVIPILKEIGDGFDELTEAQKNAAGGSRIFTDSQRALVNEAQTAWQKVKDVAAVGLVNAADALAFQLLPFPICNSTPVSSSSIWTMLLSDPAHSCHASAVSSRTPRIRFFRQPRASHMAIDAAQ